METIYYSLLGYVSWALVLGFSLITLRSLQVLLGKKKSNEFPAGIPHGSPFEWRLNRAHLNTLENLPIFLSIVFVIVSLGKIDDFVNTASIVVVISRICQSTIHLISTSVWMVNFRFTFYMIQNFTYAVVIGRIVA
ncbi:MAG: MAPEG family protein [Leptospira sp.]|nr:MAPEG family protein [Leptospira sp.]